MFRNCFIDEFGVGGTAFPPGWYLAQPPQTNKEKKPIDYIKAKCPTSERTLSHKADKRYPLRSSGPRVFGSFPMLDMVVAILSHPIMHLALYARTGRYWLSPSTDTWTSSSGCYSVYRQGSNSIYTVPRPQQLDHLLIGGQGTRKRGRLGPLTRL